LGHATADLEDFRLKQSIENEDKSKRLILLQQELKELQEKASNSNMYKELAESKNKDMQLNHERVSQENNANIIRLKTEHDRISIENNELLARLSKINKELESSKTELGRSEYNKNQERVSTDKTLSSLDQKIGETCLVNKKLEDDLKRGLKDKYDLELRTKDEKTEIERVLTDIQYNIAKAQTENEDIKQKLNNTNYLYNEA